jgi:hypothetical protein
VLDFVKKELPNTLVESGNRNTIKNNKTNRFLELDIYVPSIGLAIEYNGDYWHSRKPPGYHKNKTILCKEKGIKLLHIKESSWIMGQDVVKSTIKTTISKLLGGLNG